MDRIASKSRIVANLVKTLTRLLAGVAVAFVPMTGLADAATPAQATAIAKDAYIYGVPLVSQYRTMYAFSVAKGTPEYKGPFNSVLNIARVFTPDDTAFVTPNSDTPYTFAGLDLRAEPMVITIPKIDKRRYFVFQLMDLYTFNFAYIGSRTTGNGGGNYLIAGPRWKGSKPKGITEVFHSETEFVTVVGRTQMFNPKDLDNVKKIQAGYKMQPLSTFEGTKAPSPAPEIQWIKPLDDKESRTSLEFFNELAFLLQFAEPPHPSEIALRTRFEKIGIVAGKPFDAAKMSPEMQTALKEGMAQGQTDIDTLRASLGGKSDMLFGNREFLKNDFLKRATGTQVGIGANSRDEAMYPIYDKDSSGEPLDGSKHSYTLHFAKNQLPPVEAFWSLTMYNVPSQLLVKNPIDRYLINSPMLPDLKFDADGGLTIYIQNAPPGAEKQANWLPAPSGRFMMAARYYWPKPELLQGKWTSPQVQQAN